MQFSSLALFAPALAGALVAQDTFSAAGAVGADADPRVAVHSNAHQPGEAAYGTWAAGASYKASFHAGMTFYPQLGRDYPHNQPVAWRTTSVRVGMNELLANRAAPLPTHSDFRVEYALGPVVEAYDVRAEGLEQTFVMVKRPAGIGDLCITGEVTTSLWTEPVAELHGDLVFYDGNGTPLVRYGRALAIDADGDTFAMTTTCTGGTISLRLPAAALAQADFPLVVDPLLAPVLSHSVANTVAVGDVDGAVENHNASLNGAYVMTRHYSATDADVVARISSADMTGATTRFSDLSAATSAEHGRVAFVPQTNKWVVCFQSLNLSTQIMQIRAAMFSGGATTPVTTTSLGLTAAAGVHTWRPCVGGIAAGGTGTQALVAFQRDVGTTMFANMGDSEVWSVLFDTSSASGAFGTPFDVISAPALDAELPTVNRAAEGGTTFSWLVVSQTLYIASPSFWDLRAKLVSNAGTLSSNAWNTVSSSEHELGPVVDGTNGRYLVAYASAPSGGLAPTDVRGTSIRCQRLDWQHGATSVISPPAETLQQNALRILETGGVAYHASTKSHWTIAWRSSSTSPAIYATRVGYRGEPLQNPELVATTAASIPGWPVVVNDDANDVTSILYQRHVGTTTEVWSRTWINPNTPPSTLSAPNCSNAVLGWTGPAASPANSDQWIGSEFSQVSVSSAPANSLHLMLVGVATVYTPIADPILGTNCTLLVPLSGPDHLGFLTLAVGSTASWTLPLPENLPAMTLHFQDWVLEPANNLLWGTRRLSVPLTK